MLVNIKYTVITFGDLNPPNVNWTNFVIAGLCDVSITEHREGIGDSVSGARTCGRADCCFIDYRNSDFYQGTYNEYIGTAT